MAKAPRRRGRDRGGDGRKPRAAKPLKPPVAKPVQPVKPPAAKPVRPARPPAAKPVPPTAAPVAKPVQPMAKPVAPVAKPVGPVARPVAAPVAAPVAPAAKPAARPRGPAKRMAEEEVGRPRGRAPARGGYARSGGMGIGGKVGLLAALVTLVVVGAAVFPGGGGEPAGESQADGMNTFGFAAVSVLTGPDARWWRGGEPTRGMGYLERTFKELLGSEGEKFWDKRLQELTQPPPRDMGAFAKEKLEEDQRRFNKVVERLSGPAGPTGKKHVFARLTQIWNAIASAAKDRFQIHRAWVREVGQNDQPNGGAWLAGTRVSPSAIEYSSAGWTAHPEKVGFAWTQGKVDGDAVRIYRGFVRGAGSAKPMLAFLSVYRKGSSDAKGSAGLGLIMLVLGPLLVGFVAYSVATAHSKHVRSLAREIDRLGSSGDPTRELRAQGAEASAIARSVERMVGNLEFRSKHEGADLDEVVSKEQKVAQEIHGALISKNPPRLSNYEVETLFKPGFEIGGDHFEYFRIDDDHLGIILLDTNVRGIPAALVMAQAKSYLRAAAPGVLSPAAVLKQVNRHLAGELPPGRHVTALYVVLNTADGSATMASAGHLPLLVYRHATGKMAKVNPEGIALGLDAGPVFERALEEGDIPIGVGDRIVLYTDGALKIQDGGGDEFGEQRFYAAVTQEAPKNSQAFVNFVGGAIDRFHLEVPQNDDITISTVKRLR